MADWADFIEPEAAYEPKQKARSRKTDPSDVKSTSEVLQRALEARWPDRCIAVRIRNFADDIGWSASRAKDVYYADRRVALRAFEQDELDLWLSSQP